MTAYLRRLYDALSGGIRSGLPVIAVCAAAGVITSTIAKTGLGQVLSDLLVSAAEAIAPNDATLLVLSALFSAAAILILGLAVPVTASFILSWVIIGPALISLGVGRPEVAMFIFYYRALRGLPADRAGCGRLRRDHRRQGDPDDDAGLQVPAARVPRTDGVRGLRQRQPAALPRRPGRRGLGDNSSAPPRSPRWPWSPPAGCSARPGWPSASCASPQPCCCSTSSRPPSLPASSC